MMLMHFEINSQSTFAVQKKNNTKQKMKNVLLALALLANLTTFASSHSKVKVSKDSSSVFKVYYSGSDSKKVRVNIYNDSNEKVFSEIISNKNGFVRPYNLADLPTGNYKFEIIDNEDSRSYEFQYGSKMEVKEEVYAFVNKLSDNRFFLGLANDTEGEYTIMIYDANENEVYNSTELVKKQFSQLFNLETASSEVTFKIFKNGKTVKEFTF